LPSMISVSAMSAAPMLGRVGINGERPLFNCFTRLETMLIKTSGSLTISDAFSTRSLFMDVPGNREWGFGCSMGTMLSGDMPCLKFRDDLDRPEGGKDQIKPGMTRAKTESPQNHIRLMPKRRRTTTVSQKNPVVSRQFTPSATQKPQPCRSIQGRIRNIGRVGSTNQKVPSA